MFLIDETKHNVDKDPWPWGGEPIFRNGEFAGSLTTASFGYTHRKHIGIGYINHPDGKMSNKYIKEGSYEIEIGGKRFPATVSIKLRHISNFFREYDYVVV